MKTQHNALNEIVLAEIQKNRYLQVPAMIRCFRQMTDPESWIPSSEGRLSLPPEPERVERALFGSERVPSTFRDKDRWVMQNANEQRVSDAQVQLDQLLSPIVLDYVSKNPGFFAGRGITGETTVVPNDTGSASLLRDGAYYVASITPQIRFDRNGRVYVWFALSTSLGVETPGWGWSTAPQDGGGQDAC